MRRHHRHLRDGLRAVLQAPNGALCKCLRSQSSSSLHRSKSRSRLPRLASRFAVLPDGYSHARLQAVQSAHKSFHRPSRPHLVSHPTTNRAPHRRPRARDPRPSTDPARAGAPDGHRRRPQERLQRDHGPVVVPAHAPIQRECPQMRPERRRERTATRRLRSRCGRRREHGRECARAHSHGQEKSWCDAKRPGFVRVTGWRPRPSTTRGCIRYGALACRWAPGTRHRIRDLKRIGLSR